VKKHAAMSDLTNSIGGDQASWVDEAMKQLVQIESTFAETFADADVDQVDEQEMNGKGHIIARSGDVLITIPFFVRDGKMEPLDIFIYEGTTFPLSNDRIQELFFNEAEIGAMSTEADGLSVNRVEGSVTKPYGLSVNRVEGSVTQPYKTASLLEIALPKASMSTVRAAVESIEKEAIEKMAAGRGLDVFDKLAKFAEMPSPSRTTLYWHVKMAAPGQYSVWRHVEPMEKGAESFMVTGADGPEFFKKLGHDGILDKVDANGGEYSFLHKEDGKPFMEHQANSSIKEGALNGPMEVFDSMGERQIGISAKEVNYDGTPTGNVVFVGSNLSSRGEKVAGLHVENGGKEYANAVDNWDPHQTTRQAYSNPSSAAWLWKEAGEYFITPTFKVTQILRSGDKPTKLAAQDELGHVTNFVISDKVQRIAPISSDTPGQKVAELHHVPQSYSLVRVPAEKPVMDRDGVEQWNIFKAASDAGSGSIRLSHNGQRYFTGETQGIPESLDTALRGQTFTEKQAQSLMMSLGCTQDFSEEITKEAAEHRTVTIHGLRTSVEAADEPKPALNGAIYDKVASLRPALWKVAAEIEDEWMSDNMIGMNFLEERTTDSFLEALPTLEEVLTVLADLLVASRTDQIDIAPEVVRQAMTSLDEIVNALRALDVE